MPSVHELASLIDPNQSSPTLPPGHPFQQVQSHGSYWSVTLAEDFPTTDAWLVSFFNGNVYPFAKAETDFVWCVRGGMNADQY